MLLVLLLIQNFLCWNNFLPAQSNDPIPEMEESMDDQTITIDETLFAADPEKMAFLIGLHIVPSTILNFNNRLRVGIHLSTNRWSGIVDASYGASWMPNPWLEEGEPGLENYTFYGLRPEIRYHFATSSKNRDHDQFYLGLEAAFTYFERTLRDDRFEFGEQAFRYDEATLQRVRHSLILKLGLNLVLNEAFYIDMYGGFGVAFRQFAYRDIVNLTEIAELRTFDELFSSSFRTWGTRWVPDFAAGFRFGIYL